MHRLNIVWYIAFFLCVIIVSKMFYLQVWQHDKYAAMADEQHLGYISVKAERGHILAKDPRTKEEYPLATNVTLDHLYIDPQFMIEQNGVEDFINKVVPIIYDERQKRIQEEIRERKAIREYARRRGAEEKKQELINQGILTESGFTASGAAAFSGVAIEDLLTFNENKTRKEWEEKWQSRFEKSRDEQIKMYQNELKDKIFLKSEQRYLSILKKLPIPLSQKIKERKQQNATNLKGMVLRPEPHRIYPEKRTAANVLGYVDNAGEGQYGIEGQFETLLQGKDGKMYTEKDSHGRTVSVQGSTIEEAQDGADIVLTIDRALQAEVEKILGKHVEALDADYADVIVMNPQNGRVMAMAQYPRFDPNEYNKVFERVPIYSTDWIKEQNRQIPILEGEDGQKYIYKNKLGPAAFVNHSVQDMYEPGSIMKPISMAAAIDAGEVNPDTTFHDTGPIELDEYKVHNHDRQYRGWVNMKEVMRQSLNTGMTYIAQKLGRSLFYKYLKDFGFGERTDLGLSEESRGNLDNWKYWADIQLATVAFGQGIAVTPIQMAQAFSVIANGGNMQRPYIIDEIRYSDGSKKDIKPRVTKKVIKEETANTMKAMLTYVLDKGYWRLAEVEGYYLAGKTGTAEIPDEFGRYEDGGVGTTVASFAGFGPVDNPRFVTIVRIVRPRTSQWWSETASPVFKDIAGYILDYYDIPPSRK